MSTWGLRPRGGPAISMAGAGHPEIPRTSQEAPRDPQGTPQDPQGPPKEPQGIPKEVPALIVTTNLHGGIEPLEVSVGPMGPITCYKTI